MFDTTFAEKYDMEIKKLKGKISSKNYNGLELFFANTNLDKKQRSELLEIVSAIFSDGQSNGCHENLNKTYKSQESD